MRKGVYLPSYVEWLTCLEVERDGRKMHGEDQFGAGPYTLPRVSPAINPAARQSQRGRATRAARGEEQEPAPKRAERPRVSARGSSGAYNPALLSPPSLPLSQPSAGCPTSPPPPYPPRPTTPPKPPFPLLR